MAGCQGCIETGAGWADRPGALLLDRLTVQRIYTLFSRIAASERQARRRTQAPEQGTAGKLTGD